MKQHKQKAHAEGGAEGKAAVSDAHAEAAVEAQEQKEAETAKKKTPAEGWTNEGATGGRSKKKTEAVTTKSKDSSKKEGPSREKTSNN